MNWKTNIYLYTKIKTFTDKYINFPFEDISDFCKKHHINLIPYSSQQQELMTISEDGFSFLENGEYSIFYNSSKHEHRKRFTIAHEIGHIYLGHHNILPPYVLRYHRNNHCIWETQANIFAHNILIPVYYAKGIQHHGIANISRCFGLSQQMVAVRYIKLKEDLFWLNLVNQTKNF